MSIHEEKFDNAKDAVEFLENKSYGNDNYIFRGHKDQSYRLQTSFFRFTKLPYEEFRDTINELISYFKIGLAKIGITPFNSNKGIDWLEYARHHGVPTPCLDFTYSPYIALFFAFNDIKRKKEDKTKEYVVVYALNIVELSVAWAKFKMNNFLNKDEIVLDKKGEMDNQQTFDKIFNKFLFPDNSLFEKNFPSNTLQFIPYPSKYNRRMQNQLGALLYDTLQYNQMGFKDLEDFIEKIKEPNTYHPVQNLTIERTATLTKVKITKECIGKVLQRLELMGITAGNLYLDPDGVAMDVINSYYHTPIKSYLRGIHSFLDQNHS